jgi:hypothetical protein
MGRSAGAVQPSKPKAQAQPSSNAGKPAKKRSFLSFIDSSEFPMSRRAGQPKNYGSLQGWKLPERVGEAKSAGNQFPALAT